MRLIDADEALELSENGKYMWVYDLTDLEEFLEGVPTIDPIRAIDGCYCWECVHNIGGHCVKMGGTSIVEIGFCGGGERRAE